MKKCLLIMPLDFYSMATQICNALKTNDYDITVCNDRYPNNVIAKIFWKIGFTTMLYRTTERYISRHFLQENYDICLVIKGFGMRAALMDAIHQKCPRVIGYNFDSFAFHPLSLSWYKLADRFYTFDYIDAINQQLQVVELYSAIPFIQIDMSKKIYDISVIQKIHSNRLTYISNLLSVVRPESYYIYLYESNMITMALNIVKHPLLYFKLRKYIHTKPLSYTCYEDVLRKSVCTVDYAHPKQSGITMRCFEAKSCGTKIITNNNNIFSSTLFTHNDAIVYSENCDTESFNNQYYALIRSSIDRKHRDVSDFLKDLSLIV